MDVAVPGVGVAVVLEEVAEGVELGFDDFGAGDDLLVLVGGVGLVFRGHAVVSDFQAVSGGIVAERLRGFKV